jgi:hypothetical protein
LTLLSQPNELARILERQKKIGTPTTAQTKAGEKLFEEFTNLERANELLGLELMAQLEPFLSGVMKLATRIITFLRNALGWLGDTPLLERGGEIVHAWQGGQIAPSSGMIGSRPGFGGFRRRRGGRSGEGRGEPGTTRGGGVSHGSSDVGHGGLSRTMSTVRQEAEEEFRKQGFNIEVTSGYRSPAYNRAVGGASGSQHPHGRAIDVSLNGLTDDQAKAVVEHFITDPRVTGFGYYPRSNSIHVDVRPGTTRNAWGSDYSYRTIGAGWPAWITERVKRWQGGSATRSLAPGAPTTTTDDAEDASRVTLPGNVASVRHNNPGAQYPAPEAIKFGMTGYAVIGGGHLIADFPSPEAGAASNFDLLYRKYTGMSIGAAGRMWTGSYGFGVPGYDPSTILTKEMLDNPAFAIPFMKSIAHREAGYASPLTDEQWRRGYEIFQRGGLAAYKAAHPFAGSGILIPDVGVGSAVAGGAMSAQQHLHDDSVKSVGTVVVHSHGTDASAISKDILKELNNTFGEFKGLRDK